MDLINIGPRDFDDPALQVDLDNTWATEKLASRMGVPQESENPGAYTPDVAAPNFMDQ